MKKSFNIIIAVFIGILITIIVTNNNDIKVYKFDVVDVDLKLNNYTLVSYGKDTYIPDTYSIEIVGENKKIEDVSMFVSNNDKLLTDLVFQFPNSAKKEAIGDSLKKIKIKDDTLLSVKFKYKVNGYEKEVYHPITLKEYKVEF